MTAPALSPHAQTRHDASAPSPRELLSFVVAAAADEALVGRLELDPAERTWLRLTGPGGSEAWLIGWPPGSGTGWHDHGGASGAFAVARGALDEFAPPGSPAASDRPGVPLAPGTEVHVRLSSDSARGLPAGHVHDVRNTSAAHAVSVHVYFPALTRMQRYEHLDGLLSPHSVETSDDW